MPFAGVLLGVSGSSTFQNVKKKRKERQLYEYYSKLSLQNSLPFLFLASLSISRFPFYFSLPFPFLSFQVHIFLQKDQISLEITVSLEIFPKTSFNISFDQHCLKQNLCSKYSCMGLINLL
jgi:hypothetical protein